MNRSDSLKELTAALIAVQAEITPAVKDTDNTFFHSKYVDLAGVWETCRGSLTKNGFAVTQVSRISEPAYVTDKSGDTVVKYGVILETVLLHLSGEWISGEMFLPLAKGDPQGVGSAITYGRRYGLMAILGMVADDDDDGNAASGHNPREMNYNRGASQTAKPPQQTSQAPTGTPAAQGTPAANVTAAAPVPVDINEKYFGKGTPASEVQNALISICKDLNAAESFFTSDEGTSHRWGPAILNKYAAREFNKPLAKLNEKELVSLAAELQGILDERSAIQAESAPPSDLERVSARLAADPFDPPKDLVAQLESLAENPEAELPPSRPKADITKTTLNKLRKLIEVHDWDENVVLEKATHGAVKKLEDLSDAEGKAMIAQINAKRGTANAQ
jgi:hypothetical protein